ncbi:Rmf/CrpP family protein [Fulvimarina sp. MAC3]|uniref:ribosome modulation factor n=1 Tax=Fulvimarina sp. MAC3 TaxID=3148887 RepID=UPI0031FE0AE5
MHDEMQVLSPQAATKLARSNLAYAIDMAKAERAFYQAGRTAFQQGRNEGACPYPGSSARAKLWLLGFNEARDAEDQKLSNRWR